ncbi:MAG: phage tail tape measure protein, partial [Oscillospiraceae bacterium]|nr:phage tail tape measure protein [Oscillospiraceae bacterium]
NKVDLKAVNALLGTSSERFAELTGYIDNCEGAAAQMAKTMSDNLTGDMDAFSSALEGLGIAAFDKFETPMRTAVQAITDDISALIEEVKDGGLAEGFDKISKSAGGLITVIGEFAANDMLPVLVNGLAAILNYGGEIISIILGIKTIMVGMTLVPTITKIINAIQIANINVALLSMEFGTAAVTSTALSGGLTLAETAAALFSGKITIATAAQAAFNAVCSVNPIFLIVGAIGAVVTAIGLYISHVNRAKKSTAELAEETNKYTDAMNAVITANENNAADTNAEIGVLKDKEKRYEELRKKYSNLTRGEMAEFKSLCEDLQTVLPKGTSLIDEQTGAYISLAESIDKVCSRMEQQAILNAKYAEYEEAAGQNYDIEKQLNQAESWAKENGHYTGSSVNDINSQINLFALNEFGLSYKALLDIKQHNQQIIDEYHQLYEDTYNELNDISSSYYDIAAEQHRISGQSYADTIVSENKKILIAQKQSTTELENGFNKLNHQFNTGIIQTEAELYEKKKALLDEYGNFQLEEHWQYYEELYGYEKSFAEESRKLSEEWQQEQLDDLKDGYKQQLSAVKEGVSDMLSEYRAAKSEIESNISGYKNKLLSVGDMFSIASETDENGNTVKTYTVENIKKQMEEMRKYHSYIKKLKASGASEGLVS